MRCDTITGTKKENRQSSSIRYGERRGEIVYNNDRAGLK